MLETETETATKAAMESDTATKQQAVRRCQNPPRWYCPSSTLADCFVLAGLVAPSLQQCLLCDTFREDPPSLTVLRGSAAGA